MTRRRCLALLAPLFFVLTLSAALPSKPSGFVTDDAGVLSPAEEQRLEALLSDLERATSHEVAVVTVRSLDGRPIEDAAVELFQAWGIGKRDRDNGVLFLVAPTERRMRIEVGYGLEDVLPDGKAGRIRDEHVLPPFRAGNVSGGVVGGAEAIVAALRGTDGAPPRRDRRSGFELLFFLVVFAVVALRHPWLLLFMGRPRGRGGWGGFGGSGGGWGGGGFGGFGGGRSGGGGASGGW